MLTRNRFLAAFGLLVLAILIVGTAATGHQAAVTADPYAVVHVYHYSWNGYQYVIPVEPNTGEDWEVRATWGACGNQVGYVNVDWNGSGWALSGQQYTSQITA